MNKIKEIVSLFFTRLAYKLSSKRVWALGIATFLVWHGKITPNIWLVVTGAFLGTKIIELGQHIIEKK